VGRAQGRDCRATRTIEAGVDTEARVEIETETAAEVEVEVDTETRRPPGCLVSGPPEDGAPTRSLAELEAEFRPVGDSFFARDGRAKLAGEPKPARKLCLVATDQRFLAEILLELSNDARCHFVKYSRRPKDGMYLGRCFVTDDDLLGALWARYKRHPKLMCSLQDDAFVERFRPPG
jgi:hypothetical protein